MKYYASLWLKGLQKCLREKFQVLRNQAFGFDSYILRHFHTQNFDSFAACSHLSHYPKLWQFCSLQPLEPPGYTVSHWKVLIKERLGQNFWGNIIYGWVLNQLMYIPITNIVANFEISCQQVLSFWVDIRIRIVWNWWGIEKVEKAIIFDLFGDCTNISFTFVFLFLFYSFHCQVFSRLFPVNCASLTLENLRTWKQKKCCRIWKFQE